MRAPNPPRKPAAPQPRAQSPAGRRRRSAFPAPGVGREESGCPGRPEDREDRRAGGKKQNQKGRPDSRRGARGSAAGQRAGPGMAGAGRGSASAVTAEALSSPSPCPRQPPPPPPNPHTPPYPKPGLAKVLPSPAAPRLPSPSGERARSRLTSARPAPAHLSPRALDRSLARSPARGSHRRQINKSACGRGRRACHGEGSQQSPPLLHGGRGEPPSLPKRGKSPGSRLTSRAPAPAPVSRARPPGPGAAPPGLRRLVPPT